MDLKRTSEIVHKFPEGKTSESYAYSQSAQIFQTKQLFLYSEKLLPGRKSSAPHFHSAIDEIIYLTKGSLLAIEGEREELLQEGDSVCFYAKSEKYHYLENRSENEAEFLIFRRTIKIADTVFESVNHS